MEIVLAGLSHHDIFEVLLRLSLLLVVARLLGELTSRMGQPSVIGEILAGIILGPSILGFLWPGYSDFILPQDAIDVQLLDFMQIFGALFLLLLTGLEIDFGLIKRQFSTALSVAAGGLIVPFASGYLLALVTPDSLLLPDTDRTVFALFLGTAMTISAIPVIAKVLMDLRLTRRSIAQVIIASAMIDDAVGWVLLSVVSTLAVGEALGLLTVSLSLLKVGLFLSLGVLIGRSIMTFLLRFIQERVREQEGSLSSSVLSLPSVPLPSSSTLRRSSALLS